MSNRKWIVIQIKKMRGISLSDEEKIFRLSIADLEELKNEQIQLKKHPINGTRRIIA